MDVLPLVCPKCGNILTPDQLFCPKCGTKIEDREIAVGLGKQVWIYFVSLFLPPLGLIWTWKYLRSGSPQQKRIGWIALVLTVLGILLTLWTIGGFLQGIQTQLNSYTNLGL